ncbi:MAG: entericidin EcnAB [Phycisphaerae bacterium]|nr:entericidin EcnAB [Phycisphaerae bacterium]
MKKRNFVIIATLVMLLTSMFFMTGCNTWKGMGKDVEITGEKMQ